MSFNWGQGLAGGAAGAGMGGFMGPVGAGIGGGLGFLAGGFGGGGSSRHRGFSKLPTMTEGQEGILNDLIQQLSAGGQLGQGYGQALGGLQGFMDPSSEEMSRFADPYMRQFNQETVPGLAERFAGGGAMGGGLSSSGFGQALSSAGSGLQSQLASMKTGLQRQAIGDIMNQYKGMSGQAFGARPFGYMAPQQGFMPQMLASYAQSGFPGMQQGFNRLFNQGQTNSQGFSGNNRNTSMGFRGGV